MVTTRAMHGTSKKTDSKISVNQKAAKRPSKRAKSPRTVKVHGKKNDYLKKYYKNHPPPFNGVTPFELDCAGQLKWRGMTTKSRKRFIESKLKSLDQQTASIDLYLEVLDRARERKDDKEKQIQYG
ncbi:hypothetical protein OROMI_017733 [Orobanche minor]